MKPVLVLYATREGHSGRIASHVAAALRAHGLLVKLLRASKEPADLSLNEYAGAVLTASVHGGRHEKEIVRFVKLHLPELERMPTAFLSVSLSEADVENPEGPPERRGQAAADVKRMIEVFLTETGWRPTFVKAVAGALLYTKYNFLLRFMMKRIARKAGRDHDTSRDYEYTNWKALDRLLDEFVPAIAAPAGYPGGRILERSL